MSLYIPPQPNISQAWLETLSVVSARGGRAVNVLTTVTDPAADEMPGIREAVDRYLYPHVRRNAQIQTVQTVANTIFPNSGYRYSGPSYSVNMSEADVEALDRAADQLYGRYKALLPTLLKFNGNNRGTYFSRMVSWPGKTGDGRNQLADRIARLRGQRRNSADNVNDLVIGGEATFEDPALTDLRGVQVYAETDTRTRGFPCLVHIDLTVYDDKLSLIATYRHQQLVTKAYGNLVGLARLQRFLSEQTGYPLGELAVMATLADAEHHGPWNQGIVQAMVQSAFAETGTGLF